jgi:general secretion pathway protein M
VRLNRRERLVVGVGAALVALVLIYTLLYEPLQRRRAGQAGATVRLEQDLAEMRTLAAQYQGLVQSRERMKKRLETRSKDFSPFSYLQGLAKETGLADKIESMTPVASAAESGGTSAALEVDLRLNGIGLAELVRFLYRVETSDQAIQVVQLHIRPRYLNPEQLDVSLRLASPGGPA